MNAVVTLNIGADYAAMAELTHPLMRGYAERLGCEFVSIERPALAGRHGHYEKLQLFDLLERYERIIFLDTDILVAKDAPDLFSVVPEEGFGAFLTSRYVCHGDAIALSQEILGNIGWKECYFNSGVMIISRRHREAFNRDNGLEQYAAADPAAIRHVLCYDQTYINYLVQKFNFPLFDIGYRYNHTTAPNNSAYRFRSHLIHYPGAGHSFGPKLGQISRDLAVLESRHLRALFQKAPLVTLLCGMARLHRKRTLPSRAA